MGAKATLPRLLAEAGPPPPLDEVALALSGDLRPEADLDGARRALDALADDVRGAVGAAPSERAAAEALRDRLAGRRGFRGDRDDYYDPRNSHLDQVLARGRGLPITLTVLWAGVGRRVDVPVHGVGFPGHFLGRVGDATYVDPFDARVLDAEALAALSRRALGRAGEVPRHLLEPVSPAAVATRMLVNLVHAHGRRGDPARSLLAADLLVRVTGDPEHLRERGRLAGRLGAHAQALDDLASYLAARPDARDRRAVEAEIALARSRMPGSLQ